MLLDRADEAAGCVGAERSGPETCCQNMVSDLQMNRSHASSSTHIESAEPAEPAPPRGTSRRLPYPSDKATDNAPWRASP